MRCYNMLMFIYGMLSVHLAAVKSELFTALVDLQNLLYTEEFIVRTLERYLELEEQRLERLKWLSKEYDKLWKAANEDVDAFLSNPVNAYVLVKRLTADWKIAEFLTDGTINKEIIENITRQDWLKFPDDEDLNGAASALLRLQKTYLLDTAILARGEIKGTVSSSELLGSDCFELGLQAFRNQDYYHAVLWMQEALNRITKKDLKTFNKAFILEYMAYSNYLLGNIRDASKLTEELLQIDPNNVRVQNNLAFYSGMMQKMERESDSLKYEKLCRGEGVKSPDEEKMLSCRYFTNNNPYLFLKPVKEEELNLKPRIVVYHHILSDREMEIIKFLAKPRLARSSVLNITSGRPDIASYRISKSAFLRNEDHEVLNRMNIRIKAITGLATETAEELQVVNYGIGGHYAPHYDFVRKGEPNVFESYGTGNRIATWINYMSDVGAGGATVFPRIGVQVNPEKGSASFWYNLLKSGEHDLDTKHAACPVLIGSKWVSNKWLHERGQEFRRPCALTPND